MKTVIILITLLLYCILTNGQSVDSLNQKTKHEASLDLGAFYTPVLGKNFYGGAIDFKYYPYKRIATRFHTQLDDLNLTTMKQVG